MNIGFVRSSRTLHDCPPIAAGAALVGLRRPRGCLVQRAGLRPALRGQRGSPTRRPRIEEAERYPNHLLEDLLKKWGPWCLYNVSKDEATSKKYITGGQLVPDVELPRRSDHDHDRRGERHDQEARHRVLRQRQGPRLRRGDDLRGGRPRQHPGCRPT